jgi:hypothetical protein
MVFLLRTAAEEGRGTKGLPALLLPVIVIPSTSRQNAVRATKVVGRHPDVMEARDRFGALAA